MGFNPRKGWVIWMTTTIFLHDAHTLRVSFPWSQAAVDAIKSIGGATFDKDSKTWRAPVAKLDAILRIFGDDAAVAPEVAMSAAPKLPVQNFAETCAAAGVTLRVEGQRVTGSGGCWTPVLQAEIDKRAPQLRRLIESGWQPPQSAPAPVAPQPATLDKITHLDYVLAEGERNAIANEARKQAQAERRRRGWRRQTEQAIDAQLGIEGVL